MIVIDAGHGGYDPGGGSNIFFKEKDINLKISKYQFRRLNDLGITTKLVRDNDVTLTPSQRINRISTIGPSSNDILISNHVNVGGDIGGEVIYSIRGDKTLPNLIATNLNAVGLQIRNVYQKRGKTGNDYYFVLRQTIPKNAMIIEYGFADNAEDTYRLRFYWPRLAEAVVKALCTYLNVTYKPDKYTTYIVKPNDSLYEIAKNNNTTVTKIMKDNNLTNEKIYPEDILLLY